ncbi:hypothetical protein [Saccharopolyspora antimicrobica]|uniref:hypothetical protein n=1 Tax=Saccharopolyspora antimicrobica TaxID=455193 RepID=UPI000EB60C62|nr:hypothetical protein [Saccharopolyspora antimicrobica]
MTAGLGVRIGGYLHDTLRSGLGQQPGGLHPGCAPRPGKFGGFTLMVVYLLLSLGAVRGLRGHPRPASVWVASTIGAVLPVARSSVPSTGFPPRRSGHPSAP